MGLFSGSTKIVVGASAMHLVDASANPVNDAVISTILMSGVPYMTHRDIPANILKTLFSSFGVKMRLVYDYAKTDYKLGLPSGETLGTNPIGDEVIAPYIAAEIGWTDGILVTNHIYTQMNAGIAIYDFLINTRDYDGDTNIVNIWPAGVSFTSYWGEDVDDFPQRVTIDKIEASADKSTATIYYTLAIYRTIVIDEGGPDTPPTLSTEWFTDPNITSEDVPIPDYADIKWNSDCLFALYQKIDSGANLLPEVYSWIYQLEDNLYPALHPDVSEQLVGFLPVVPIRYNNVDMTDPTIQNVPEDDTNLYSTSKKMLNFLNIDFHGLGDRINENPDIAEIDHAYVMWGVDLQTDYPESLYYLNEFFSDLEQLQYSNELDFLATLADPDIRDEPISRYIVNPEGRAFSGTTSTAPDEAFKEYGLILDLEYDFISSSNDVGILGDGKIGYTEKSYETYEVTISNTNYDNEGIPSVSTRDETRHRLILRAQTATNIIRTVEVSNPKITNWIYGTKHVTTGIEDINNDEDNHNMIFPLQYNITEPYDISFKSILYSDSTILVINSINKIKVKWYQSSFFKFVIMVVAIIISVWSGQAWIAELASAYASGGIIAALIFVGGTVIASIAISELANWIVEEFGAKVGILGAVVLMIVGLIVSRGIGIGGQATQFMITTAQTMTQISTALISSANEFLVEEGAKIQNEYETFLEEMEGLWGELEDIQDLLANKADIDPLLFTKPNQFMIVPSETPTQFFDRCLGLVENTMFTIHGDIYNFMDMRLKSDRNMSKEMQQMNLYK